MKVFVKIVFMVIGLAVSVVLATLINIAVIPEKYNGEDINGVVEFKFSFAFQASLLMFFFALALAIIFRKKIASAIFALIGIFWASGAVQIWIDEVGLVFNALLGVLLINFVLQSLIFVVIAKSTGENSSKIFSAIYFLLLIIVCTSCGIGYWIDTDIVFYPILAVFAVAFILLSGAFMKITKSSGKIASKILIAVYSLWIILCILRMLLYFLPVETFSEMLEYLRGGNGGTADVSE